MISTADFKNGTCFELNHDLWTIIEFQHVKPGKGPAFVRTKMKSLTSGKILENTFPSGHKVQEARVERRDYQFLYKDDSGYHFMNNETYEQTFLDEKLIDAPQFLKEGDSAQLIYHVEKDEILACELPQHIVLQVTQSDPGVKGDTATNVTKPATLETGAEVKVPIFISEGDLIKVDTKTGSYLERVKS